ncbi:hypothetical protein FQR65_LT19811 [Abscondita terminalis]|nr:hypothetical protein FQR65_LT19811 [Abscondita terminalis]
MNINYNNTVDDLGSCSKNVLSNDTIIDSVKNNEIAVYRPTTITDIVTVDNINIKHSGEVENIAPYQNNLEHGFLSWPA